jgi:Metallo-peptidase family M12B Reprolysin-like/Ig-like domain CHU_C associated
LKTRLFTLLFLATALTSFSQNVKPFRFKLSTLDYQSRLKTSPIAYSIDKMTKLSESSKTTINLPLPNGKFKTFKVVESEVMGDELSTNFPGIKSYRLFGENKNENISGSLTISESGLQAILFTQNGEVLINTDKAYGTEYNSEYQDLNELTESCGVDAQHLSKIKKNTNARTSGAAIKNGTQIRTYRIAIITNGEFYTNNGGTISSAQTAVNSIINSLKAVYERELSVSFKLVATKIYTDAATDPFNGYNATAAANAFGALALSDPTNFAVTNYDLGQVLNYSIGGGGVAFLNSVCNNYNVSTGISPIKGGGFSGVTINNIASLIHEVGHQFGAGHTFNSVSGDCASGNIMNDFAVEPGSGSTFMSYLSGCAPDNLNTSIGRAYFHSSCIEDMLYYIQNSTVCNSIVTNTNRPPAVNANGNKTVPKGTPFKLIGLGYDPDGHALLYNWDQVDAAPLPLAVRGGADDAQNSLYSPLFRSVEPTITGNVRTFPTLNQILNGENKANNDEALPQVARALNMRFVARDNIAGGGGLDFQDIVVIVDNSGPFLLTSQNMPNIWITGDTKTITWTVNNTDKAPLFVGFVNILLSLDGGQTFPTVLASATPNDGKQVITVPATLSNLVRIKLEPSSASEIFFDINNANISIVNSFTCSNETSTIRPNLAFESVVGSKDLNLPMYPFKAVTSFNVTTETTDKAMPLLGLKNGSCAAPFSNSPFYKTLSFRVTNNGTYVFSKSISTGSFNIYKNSFDPANPCMNWVGTSLDFANITSTNPVNIELLADTSYVMVVSTGLSSTSTGTMTINVGSQGTFMLCLPMINSFYDYAFVITNSSNIIISVQDNTDLSDPSKFTNGNYTIWGLAYLGGADIKQYIEKPLGDLQNYILRNSVCGVLSSNSRNITINCGTSSKIESYSKTLCASGSTTLSVTGCAGTYNWYEAMAGGQVIASNLSLITPILSTSKTYYVECLSTACNVERTPINVVIVEPISPKTSVSNVVLGNPAILSATDCVNGNVNWYDAKTGGNVIGSGATFTTEAISSTLPSKTYFASCNIGTCESVERTAIPISNCNSQNLVISAPIISTGIISNRTDGKILANNKIMPLNGTAVTYASKSSITFEPGFEVSSVDGASFTSIIQGCIN